MASQNPTEKSSIHSLPIPGADADIERAHEPESPPTGRQIHGFQWFLVVVAVLSSMFMYSLDGTIVADLVPSIANEFHAVPLLPWLSVGFMVGSIVTVLPLGKLYGKYNAKHLYLISVVIFLAASALCGAAPNMSAMIVGRVLLGMAGNGIYFGILTLLSVHTDDTERPMYLSMVGLIWGVGTVLGPVVGGGFDKVNWRWAFYLNLIIGGLFAPVYVFLLPAFDPSPSTSFVARGKNFDLLGATLSIASILCLVMAINFGNALYAWDSAPIIVLFVLAGVFLILFAIQQKLALFTTKSERMFPAHLLRSKEACLLFVAAAGCNAAGFLPVYYIPVYFQFSRGDNALEAAVRLLPLIIVLSATIMAQGFFMSKLGYYQPWYLVGGALLLVGDVLLSRIDENTNVANIYGYEILVAIGAGAFIQAGYATIQTVVPASDTSYAIAFMMLAQFIGIVFGLSIGGAIFINTALSSLRSLLPLLSEADLRVVISGTSSNAIELIPVALRDDAVAAIVGSLRKLFIPAYVAAAVALVVSVFINIADVILELLDGKEVHNNQYELQISDSTRQVAQELYNDDGIDAEYIHIYIHCMEKIDALHSGRAVHSDIKPDVFMNCASVMIDFSSSWSWEDGKDEPCLDPFRRRQGPTTFESRSKGERDGFRCEHNGDDLLSHPNPGVVYVQESRSHFRDPTLRDRVPFLRDCPRCQQAVKEIISSADMSKLEQAEREAEMTTVQIVSTE
ncbi:hypothetical protein V499_02163 [Pseudogymnoascus sp. VKM F-103]|nr:hypothetical protein V499_02163 [Pseudogymnoascus sp. VKM F-103]